MARATKATLNSAHCGGAVRVIRSKSDLQSVTATSISAGDVATEMAGAIRVKASSGLFQGVLGL